MRCVLVLYGFKVARHAAALVVPWQRWRWGMNAHEQAVLDLMTSRDLIPT
jgi:hypothetical protein